MRAIRAKYVERSRLIVIKLRSFIRRNIRKPFFFLLFFFVCKDIKIFEALVAVADFYEFRQNSKIQYICTILCEVSKVTIRHF